MQLRIVNHSRSRRAAFTLMEVLVVLAILVVLAGVGIGVWRYLETSKESAAQLDIKDLEKAATSFKLDQGDWPQDLSLLAQPTDGKPAYIKPEKLRDPWGRPYVIDLERRNPYTGEPLIYSQGSNPGQSKPITNWK
jgi:general secretion pathway protein G